MLTAEKVDFHSQTCFIEEQAICDGMVQLDHFQIISEFNNRIFKLIQSLIRRLDSESLDEVIDGIEEKIQVAIEQRTLLHSIIQLSNMALSEELPTLQMAADKLYFLEQNRNLGKLLHFNEHLIFNRVCYLIVQKEEELLQQLA